MLKLFIKKYAPYICLTTFAAIVLIGGILVTAHPDEHILINEVCTQNVASLENAEGDHPDWIELYNPTEHDIDVSGYVITKSTYIKKLKYIVPDGTVISPGAYYLVDPGFALSSNGCSVSLLDGNRRLIDRIDVPELKYDTSYARVDDGSGEWDIKEPTPGFENSYSTVLLPVAEGGVDADLDPGFYDEEVDVSLISTHSEGSIYYTTDGSDPKENGILYEGPIHVSDRSKDVNVYSMIPEVSKQYMDNSVSLPSYPVDKCTIIRAVAKDDKGRYTDTDTFTYFVGYGDKKAYDNMTIVSVTADPDDLFSADRGIMVLGSNYDTFVEEGEPEEYDGIKANFTERGHGSEREASIEIFDNAHEPVLNTLAGLRVKGLSSRWYPQKSFSIYFRNAYGGDSSEEFSTDGEIFDVHSFALDKCGQDEGTKMKDVIMERCMADTGCSVVRRIPCCVFLNGEYWGFYWLAEKFDRTYFKNNYGIDYDDVEIVENTELFDSDRWGEEYFDRQSLLEYYAANTIVAHEGDWPNFNFRFWRTKTLGNIPESDGKFRPFIFDMNSDSMQAPDFDEFSYLLEWFWPFLKLTKDDDDFRRDLADKIDKMRTCEFEEGRVLSLIDELHDRINDQMVLDMMRYTNCSKEEAQRCFDANVEGLRDFFRNRGKYLDKQKEAFVNGE